MMRLIRQPIGQNVNCTNSRPKGSRTTQRLNTTTRILVSQRDDAQILPTPGSRVKEIPATFRQSPNFPGCPTRNSLPVCRTQQHAIAGLAKMNPNLLPAGYFSIV